MRHPGGRIRFDSIRQRNLVGCWQETAGAGSLHFDRMACSVFHTVLVRPSNGHLTFAWLVLYHLSIDVWFWREYYWLASVCSVGLRPPWPWINDHSRRRRLTRDEGYSNDNACMHAWKCWQEGGIGRLIWWCGVMVAMIIIICVVADLVRTRYWILFLSLLFFIFSHTTFVCGHPDVWGHSSCSLYRSSGLSVPLHTRRRTKKIKSSKVLAMAKKERVYVYYPFYMALPPALPAPSASIPLEHKE